MVPARVTRICDRPRLYEVQLPNGNVIERNRRHLHGPVYDDSCKSETAQSNVSDRTNVNVSAGSPTKYVTGASPSVNMRTRSGREIRKPEYLKDYVQ